jgi:hypothetical protein
MVALEPHIHLEYSVWWNQVKTEIKRVFLEDGTVEQWRTLIRGEMDMSLPAAKGAGR